jgi:hypothetical protein
MTASVTHTPKAGELLTGEEYEAADHHVVAITPADIGASADDHDHAADYSALAHEHDADYDATGTAAGAVTTHEAAVDPHAGYRLESADHTHATTGLQGGTVAHSALTGLTTGDPHTQYRLESEDHTHATTGAQGGTVAHSALTGLTAGDPHTQYLLEADANWVDLTDGGATTLHSHAGGSGAPTDVDYLVGTANGTLSNEIVVGTTPGGELGGTWASPTVDATHSGSTHAATQAAAEATASSALGVHAAAADPHTGYRLESADHTHASTGLQAGQIAFSALTGYPAITSASAFATATTTVSAATYADITGASISLVAGTWLVFGQVTIGLANAIIQAFVAITHNDNTVISEVAASRPASGTASLISPFTVSVVGIVSPGSTTTYKLRGARGLTTHTGSWTAMDGNGVNTTNHASNNTDKSTGIFAIRIA